MNVVDPAHPATQGPPGAQLGARRTSGTTSPPSPREGPRPRSSSTRTRTRSRTASAEADDHPIAWCSNYDGGRHFYTALGHMGTLLGRSRLPRRTSSARSSGRRARPRATAGPSARGSRRTPRSTRSRSTTPPRTRWRSRSTTTATSTTSSWPARSSTTTAPSGAIRTVATIPVHRGNENGLLGITLDPDFADQPLALPLLQRAEPRGAARLALHASRTDGTLDMDSEKLLLTIPHQRIICCHSAGSMTFGPDGNLYISTGDDTQHAESQGYNPIDDRLAQRARRQPGRRPRARRAALVGQHERPARQDPAHHAEGRRHLHGPGRATSSASAASTPAWRARPGPRSTRWVTATRSGSRSTRRRAGSTTARSARTRATRTPTAARAATTSSTRSARPATWAGRTASPTTRPYSNWDFATQTHERPLRLRRRRRGRTKAR